MVGRNTITVIVMMFVCVEWDDGERAGGGGGGGREGYEVVLGINLIWI